MNRLQEGRKGNVRSESEEGKSKEESADEQFEGFVGGVGRIKERKVEENLPGRRKTG